jgi:hypothetical protein
MAKIHNQRLQRTVLPARYVSKSAAEHGRYAFQSGVKSG